MKIWTEDEQGNLLLGTHLICCANSRDIASSTSTISLRDSRQLILTISPTTESPDETLSALLVVDCIESRRVLWRTLLTARPNVLQYSLAAVALIGVGWTFGAARYRSELLSARSRVASMEREVTATRSAPSAVSSNLPAGTAAVMTQRLFPYDLNDRGGATTDVPVVSLPAQIALLRLELPIAATTGRRYRCVLRLFPGRSEILTERSVILGNLQPQFLFSTYRLTCWRTVKTIWSN